MFNPEPCMLYNFGRANPVQPISSKKPAASPITIPLALKLGANTGETRAVSVKSTARTRTGAVSSATPYQRMLTRQRPMRESRNVSTYAFVFQVGRGTG